MDDEKVKKLLHKLRGVSIPPSRKELAYKIKENIPEAFPRHKGLDTISIIIDLRISRLAAAAVVVITMLLFASFLGRENATSDNILEDSKMLIQYWFRDNKVKDNVFRDSSNLLRNLVPENRENVQYFGQIVEPGDSEAVLMYWKMDDGRYQVIFGDLQVGTLTADELLQAQSKMLNKRVD